MYKLCLALNDPQRLICYKPKHRHLFNTIHLFALGRMIPRVLCNINYDILCTDKRFQIFYTNNFINRSKYCNVS